MCLQCAANSFKFVDGNMHRCHTQQLGLAAHVHVVSMCEHSKPKVHGPLTYKDMWQTAKKLVLVTAQLQDLYRHTSLFVYMILRPVNPIF